MEGCTLAAVMQPSVFARARIVFYLRQKYSFLCCLQDFGKDFGLLVKNRSESERGGENQKNYFISDDKLSTFSSM
jgi:hypothetical protein